MHKNMIKSNQSVAIPQKQSNHHHQQKQNNFEESDTLHMGVAVPLSSEDLEKELIKKPIASSTQKDGISTWILLSGGNNGGQNSKIAPTTETPTRSSIRYESKIEKVTKIRSSTTIKPKYKPTTTATVSTTIVPSAKVEHIKSVQLIDSNQSKLNQQNNQVRQKKTTTTTTTTTTTIKPEVTTKKHINKKVTTTKTSTSVSPKTSPSSAPSTTADITTAAATTVDPIDIEPTIAASVESTTFLIMEPKDADFDLPQDRSPGTTKKPKKNKTKKNKTKADPKKPIKTQIANKDKPLSTKIYNYLAREVMPTVGVGLVGLTVAAGLATYFLVPFGALRRSYDDAADRKDDMYYYNNEEYAGPDGQLEEEAFGKVIAGMPINSPYRNTIRYTVQQQPPSSQQQQQQLRQPNQISRPGAKYVHYPVAAPQYRVRNVAPAGYQAVVQQHQQQQQQYNSFQQPNHPVYTKRRDPYPQQFYRYNDESSIGMYRKNSNLELSQEQHEHKQIQNSPSIKIDAQKSDEKSYESENAYNQQPSIVTAEPYFDNPIPGSGSSDMKILDDNVLSKRTQFVVGTTVDDDEKDVSLQKTEEILKETADVIPEHGPRRRRRRSVHKRKININENEIDGIIPENLNPTDEPITKDTTININMDTEENLKKVTTESPKNPQASTTKRPNVVELIKDLFEAKVRIGLSFLQRTTTAVQKYLRNIEKRVDESKIFQNNKKN